MTKLYDTINNSRKIKELYNELYNEAINDAISGGSDYPLEEDFSIEIMDEIIWFHYDTLDIPIDTTTLKPKEIEKSFQSHKRALEKLGVDVGERPDKLSPAQFIKSLKDAFVIRLNEKGLALFKAREIASYLISLKKG